MTLFAEGIDHRLTSPDFFQDPWSVYRDLREQAPVYWCEPWGQWLVTRHEDVSFMLKQPALFSSSGWEAKYLAQLPAGSRERLPGVYRHYETKVVSNSDPPAHTRLRRLVQRSFSPRVIAEMREEINSLVADMFAGYSHGAMIDWVSEVAYPLPATVIALLFGAPVEDRHRFERWSADIVAFVGSGSPRMELALQEEQSLAEFRDYLEWLIKQRRTNPSDDLLSLLISKSDDGDQLTQDELVSMCITFLFAGHETTANLLSSLVLQLMRNRRDWDAIVGDPAVAVAATEETLRFNGPVQRVRRVAAKDLMLGNVNIAKGDLVMGFLGSANRDESVFPQAHRFDVSRSTEQHVAFGGGIHFCLGSVLSRLEAPIVVQALATRFPNTRLAESFVERYQPNMTFRGLCNLPIELLR